MTNHICPSCGAGGVSVFYEVEQAPVHSVMLLSSRQEAINYDRGDIALGFCESCGFITNTAFESGLQDYSAGYEATQGYSATFNTFHRNLAQRLIDRYDLYHKDIIEIGCGQGEFLTLLCELGHNRGVGFDPAYIPGRNQSEATGQVSFVTDFYSEKYGHYHGDFVCCKMTLEHIHNTAEFVSTVRRSIGDRTDTIVFFQVPNARYVLGEVAFWDIYYEHCSYFTQGALERVFLDCGFEVLDSWKDFGGQYLLIEARPLPAGVAPSWAVSERVEDVAAKVRSFAEEVPRVIEQWRERFQSWAAADKRVVIWGAGSKGVAFLTTLGVQEPLQFAVDINPHKHGYFMPGTGHEVVSPEFLRDYHPDVVVVMNEIYLDEIGRQLADMGLSPKLVSV